MSVLSMRGRDKTQHGRSFLILLKRRLRLQVIDLIDVTIAIKMNIADLAAD